MDLRDVVDEEDNVVGQATKQLISEKGLICRVSFIMLVDGKGRLLLQQRSASKRAYPLYWSGAVAGHLSSGESYEEAARREMMEELGIEAELEFLGKFFSAEDREMVAVFLGHHDGPVEIERREIAQIRYFTPATLKAKLSDMKVTSFVERALPLVLSRLASQDIN